MTVRVLAALLVLTAPSTGPNVDVSNLPGAQSETAITIDPTNDRTLLAGSNSFPEGTMRAYGSTDGGETWQGTTVFAAPTSRTRTGRATFATPSGPRRRRKPVGGAR